MKKAPHPRRKTSRTTTSSTRKKRSSRRNGNPKKNTETDSGSVYLGLGSNLGDPKSRLEEALHQIARIASVARVSGFYRSEPVGYAPQPDFVNAVVEVRWNGSPKALLAAVRQIETRVGRTPTFPNGPREIDIDILDFAGRVRSRPDPVLPHPRLATRRFVLAPLAEISPDWKHPVSGRTARELLAELPRRPAVRRLRLSPGKRS